MGVSSTGAILVGVLISLTAVPALLGFWPDAVLSRRGGRKGARGARIWGRWSRLSRGNRWSGRSRAAEADAQATGATGAAGKTPWGVRWARFVARRPVPVLILTVVGLGALAMPALDLRMGMPGAEAKSTWTTARRAYDALAEGFGPGFNGSLTVVVDVERAADPQAAVTAVADELAATEGIVSVFPPRFNKAEDAAILSAVPSTAPAGEQTQDLIHTLRGERPAVEAATGAEYKITGTTALNIDVARRMQDALVPYLAVVVGIAFLLLMLVFRSVLVPLKAALGYLLSVLASLGAIVLVFQQGHIASLFGVEETGPIMSTMPIFLVGIIFGLAMDYEVFLVSRIREAHIHGEDPRHPVVSGFRHSAPVVGAAALIMMAVFGGFMTGGETMVKMVGFGLASAVFFDAFVVRMAFVPAVLALLGKAAWWLPRLADRLLPRVDVEGEALTRRTRGTGDAPGTAPPRSVPPWASDPRREGEGAAPAHPGGPLALPPPQHPHPRYHRDAPATDTLRGAVPTRLTEPRDAPAEAAALCLPGAVVAVAAAGEHLLHLGLQALLHYGAAVAVALEDRGGRGLDLLGLLHPHAVQADAPGARSTSCW